LLNGDGDAVRYLLDLGVDINARANDGWTPLHMAAATFVGNGQIDGRKLDYSKRDLLLLVMNAGADLSQTTEDGWTALHAVVANAHTGWRGVEAQALDRIRDLLDAGIDVNARDIHGRTALHLAALQGYFNFKNNLPAVFPDVVDILLASGADANIKDNEGHTALFYAHKMAYDKIVLSLEKNETDKENADIELSQVREQDTGSDATPSLGPELLKAAWDGDIEKVKNLLSQGADTGYIDSDGFTALARAKDNGHDEIVMLLEEASR
jgi:ankyrin repeat protein